MQDELERAHARLSKAIDEATKTAYLEGAQAGARLVHRTWASAVVDILSALMRLRDEWPAPSRTGIGAGRLAVEDAIDVVTHHAAKVIDASEKKAEGTA